MKILIVGNGKHVQKRIINSIIKLPKLTELSILDRNISKKIYQNNITYLNYEELFSQEANFDSIIIATPPASHIEIFNKLKKLSTKFIIEKPLTTSSKYLNEENIFDLNKDKVIFDSLMYLYHPLWEEAKKVFDNEKIIEVKASFTIPELDEADFRYDTSQGGGFTYDCGIYPISLFFNLYNKEYVIQNYEINYSKDFSVDLNGSLKIRTDNDILFHITWGVTGNYKNELLLKTEDKEYYFPFIFSKPDSYLSYYEINNRDKREKITVGMFDQFYEMYEKYTKTGFKPGNGYKSKTKLSYNLIFDLLSKKKNFSQ